MYKARISRHASWHQLWGKYLQIHYPSPDLRRRASAHSFLLNGDLKNEWCPKHKKTCGLISPNSAERENNALMNVPPPLLKCQCNVLLRGLWVARTHRPRFHPCPRHRCFSHRASGTQTPHSETENQFSMSCCSDFCWNLAQRGFQRLTWYWPRRGQSFPPSSPLPQESFWKPSQSSAHLPRHQMRWCWSPSFSYSAPFYIWHLAKERIRHKKM